MLVIFPKMCKSITNPIYATENSNIVFGDIFHPSASSPKNEKPLFLSTAPPPANGFLFDFDLSYAIFLANSFLSPPSITDIGFIYYKL